MLALVKTLCSSWDILEIKKKLVSICISQLLTLLSFTKVLVKTRIIQRPVSNSNQSISNLNQSLFSDLLSIIDLQKVYYIDFKQNQASIFFSGLGAGLNFFFWRKSWFFCISKHLRQKNMKSYEFSFSPSNSMKINQ